MCIICVKPKNIDIPNEKTLRTMFENNPDGCGYMYPYKGMVQIKKGFMTFEAFKKSLKKLPDTKNMPIIFHFRISTDGLVDGGNCHPFPVIENKEKMRLTSNRCNLGMVHNGILYDFKPDKKSIYNDTQTFISECVSIFPKFFYRNKKYVNLLNRLIGSSKLAFLDKNGELTLIGDFIEDNGLYFSNNSYISQINAFMSHNHNYDYDYYFDLEEKLIKKLENDEKIKEYDFIEYILENFYPEKYENELEYYYIDDILVKVNLETFTAERIDEK